MRKRKKAQNRGMPILVVPKHFDDDEEMGTVASSVEQELLYEPTSGRYQGQDTEFELLFARTGNEDPDKYYKVSGQGFLKTTEDASGFIIMDIVDGFAAKDGSAASWAEERRPFASTAEQKAMCPKPSCGKGCRQASPGIDGKPSMDIADADRVQCQGTFDFKNDSFDGKWQDAKQSGVYQLALRGAQEPKQPIGAVPEEQPKKSFARRVGNKFLNLFRRKPQA